MDQRKSADDNDAGSDWDDEDSTLDFTSPREQNKINLRSSFNSHRGLQDEDDDDDQSEEVNVKPKPKERSTNNKQYDNSDAAQRGSNLIPKQRISADVSPNLSSRHPTTDNPPFDFKGVLPDERKMEDVDRRPGRERKGNMYDVQKRAPPQTGIAVDNSGVGSWDDSDAEERTLRELNATLKKEKKREYDEELKQRKKEKREAERMHQFPSTRSERAEQGYNSGRNQQGKMQTYEDESRQSERQEVMTPYTTSDVVVNVHGGDKQYDAANDLLPVIFHDERGARMLYHFKPCNMKLYEVPDTEEEAVMPRVADKAEKVMRRMWLEVFGSLRLVTSIFIICITEAIMYIFRHVFQPIAIGLISGVGDFFLKPLLSLTFSLIVQPVVVFLWNTMTAVRHLSQPVIDILHGILSQVAMVLRAFRLFEITYENSSTRPIRTV